METWCSRFGFSSAEYRGSITALVLLATLFLIQARMLLAFLGHPSTLLAHVQPSVNLHPQGPFPPGSFPATLPQACSAVWGCCDPSAGLALLLVELHTIGLTQTAQPVQIPLQNLPALKEISPPTQPDVVGNLTEGALNPPGCIIDKVLKEDWPQH